MAESMVQINSLVHFLNPRSRMRFAPSEALRVGMTPLERAVAMMEYVSRSFSLNVALLPWNYLHSYVGAYLLFRLIDTIEDMDERVLVRADKQTLLAQIEGLLSTESATSLRLAEAFQPAVLTCLRTEAMGPYLAGFDGTPKERSKIDAELYMLAHQDILDDLFAQISVDERAIVFRHARECVRGMNEFTSVVERQNGRLVSFEQLLRYCYFVAGLVGELLTDLICYNEAKDARDHERMTRLAPHLGNILQLTNIAKDEATDAVRWLPSEANPYADGATRADISRYLEAQFPKVDQYLHLIRNVRTKLAIGLPFEIARASLSLLNPSAPRRKVSRKAIVGMIARQLWSYRGEIRPSTIWDAPVGTHAH